MNQNEYKTVRLPKEIVEEVDNIVKKRLCGYTSRAEFIKEAVRQRILEIRRGKGV